MLKPEITETLNVIKVNWTRAVLYKTVISDLSDLRNVHYDMLVFFSPAGIEALLKNFPDFKQNDTKIAVFGNTTIKAASEAGLRVDLAAPSSETLSMAIALEKYIAEANRAK